MIKKTLLCSSLLIAVGQLSAQVLVGSYTADGDATDDGIWFESTGSGNNLNLNGVSTDPVAPGGGGFTNSFSFGDTGDPAYATTGPALYQSLTDMSVDIWFKADNNTQTSALFSTGGQQRGFTIAYDAGNINFFGKDGQGGDADSKIAFSAALGVDAVQDFVRVTTLINDTDNVVSLFANGSLIGSSSAVFSDFTGSNNTTIGGVSAGDQIGGGDTTAGGATTIDDMSAYGDAGSAFLGDIAAVYVYDGLVAIPEPSSFAFLAVAFSLGAISARRRRR